MPNASGYITTADIRRMRELRATGMAFRAIARTVGCSETTVRTYAGDVAVPTAAKRTKPRRRPHRRVASYDRFARLAAAFVPMLGGARA